MNLLRIPNLLSDNARPLADLGLMGLGMALWVAIGIASGWLLFQVAGEGAVTVYGFGYFCWGLLSLFLSCEFDWRLGQGLVTWTAWSLVMWLVLALIGLAAHSSVLWLGGLVPLGVAVIMAMNLYEYHYSRNG